MNPNTTKNQMTPIDNAFQFPTPITPVHLAPKFTNVCIFCNHPESISLMPDGSYRQCSRCHKNFKPIIERVNDKRPKPATPYI